MSRRRLLAIIRKEFLHIFRDPRSLIAAIGIPVIMMFLYCYSLSLDVNRIPTAVLDLSHSSRSRDLIERFASSGYFQIQRYVQNNRELQNALDSGECVIGIVIPSRFSSLVKKISSAIPVQILVDGTDPQRGSVSMGYSMLIGQTISTELLAERMTLMGAGKIVTPVEARPRIWYNPSLRSKNFIIPGLIAIIMAILAALLTSLTLSREWENGTMELLISTPVKPQEVIFGKLIPYFCLGLVDTIIIMLAGRFLFDVPVKGSLPLVALFVLSFLVGVLTLGIYISAVTRAQLLSSQTSMLVTYLPSIQLSGFVFYIPGMPKIIQLISYLVPARHFVTSLKGIYLKAVDLRVLWPELLFLLLFDLLILFAATRRFVKKLEPQ